MSFDVPTEKQIKREWFYAHPKKVQDLYREFPELGKAAFKMRGMAEWVIRVKSSGEMAAVLYEQDS